MNSTEYLLYNILSICRTESCTCFKFATLYSGVGFIIAIKSNVGYITVPRSTFALKIVLGVSTDYSYGYRSMYWPQFP